MASDDKVLLGLSGVQREDSVHDLRRLLAECSYSKSWEVSFFVAWVLLGIIFLLACLRLGCRIASWYGRHPEDLSLNAIVPEEDLQLPPPPPPFPPARTSATLSTADAQTEPHLFPPARTLATSSTAEAQTEPQVTVELEPGAQRPLDLVCCVDSSVSVGEEDLLKSVAFLRLMAGKLEMPAVQMGVIRFHHDFRVFSEVTGDAIALSRRLEGMGFEPGETKMASPLRHAGMMLRCGVKGACDSGRSKAVLVITDGDPNDLQEAEQEADALKAQGVLLVFVLIGDLVQPHVIQRLASPSNEERKHIIELRSYDDLASAVAEVLHNLVEVSMWVRKAKANINLKGWSEVRDVSKQPGEEVVVPGWVRKGEECWCWEPRAGRCLEATRCERWDSHYEERKQPLLQSGSDKMQHEASCQQPLRSSPQASPLQKQQGGMLQLFEAFGAPQEKLQSEMGTQTAVQPGMVCSTQSHEQPRAVASTQTAAQPGMVCGTQTDEQPRAVASTQTEPPACEGIATQTDETSIEMPVSSAAADETSREMPVSETLLASAEAQTDPLVHACLAPWRHAPLDLVICVDSSASFCLARQPLPGGPPGRSQFVETGAFEDAKSFVGCLAQAVQMPEVQLALLRFEDLEETICPLTSELDDFMDKLGAMEPSVGETKFAPPLRRALDMLTNHSSRRSGWAADMKVDRAVLVITDGDPNDSDEAQRAAKDLGDRGIQLLFVKVGRKASHTKLQHLASPKPLPPPASLVQQRELAPESRGVFEAVPGTLDTLHALVPEVLQQLLTVTRYISHARFKLPLHPYQEVTAAELDATPGADVALCNNRLARQAQYIETAPVMWDACELDRGLSELPRLIWARDHDIALTRSVPKREEPPGDALAADQSPHDATQQLLGSPQAQHDQATRRLRADPLRVEQRMSVSSGLQEAEAALQNFSAHINRARTHALA